MSSWEIIRWWELRRLLHNAILLVIGIAAIFAMDFFAQKVSSVGDAPELETGLIIFFYGFMANVCYTSGWIVELAGRKTDEVLARSRARKHFWFGLWLSCLLTNTPFWFGYIFWLSHRVR
jgi:hypothetical protein